MPIISLTYNDINEMVQQAVRSVLNESVKEVQGSIMAEKEDVVQEIIDYIENEWKRIKESGQSPAQEGPYTYNDGNITFTGEKRDYIIIVPVELSRNLGIAYNFEINVAVSDYEVPKDKLHCFDIIMRASEGESYGGPEYTQYIRSRKIVGKGRIDMYTPSINGELQTHGLYSTLYHELNHGASRLSLQSKHENLPDSELDHMGFFTASRRGGSKNPHYATAYEMSAQDEDPWAKFLSSIFNTPQDKELKEWRKKISKIFYAIWETTERNARAESIYGELKNMNATRENFNETYQQTILCRHIKDLGELIDEFEKIPTDPRNLLSRVWVYAAEIMNMNRRGKNNSIRLNATQRYYEAVKQRFLSRSRKLLDILRKKTMKVAELYFQRHEPQQGPSRLQQYKDAKKAQEELKKKQNLFQAIFGKRANR